MIPQPTHRAVIDVGHKCNVKCQHCYHAHEIGSAFKSYETIIAEIDKAISRGNNYIDFTGGEPSIHPKMPMIIRYCTQKDIGTCIITNGIAGKNTIKNIIDEGIDDWLISVHGLESTHNTIVQLKDARKRQERFLDQLVKNKQHFRFNCTLTKWNQSELVRLAKWTKKWKPGIFNFINFNPHNEWMNDEAGTKKIIADLRIVEPQINEAIAILEDAGIGVNLRYYPMCRVNESFRHTVCNDLQVLFDPYEWDYDIVPKNYNNYYKSATTLSAQNEWKGQPCQSCDLRFICGGLNSAFHRASGMKQIDQIKDTTIVRDDIYHYRRKNICCLTDRKPSGSRACITAVVDENMMHLVPLFLYTAFKSYPDIDVLVFTRCTITPSLKTIVDQVIGYGYFDSRVKVIDSEWSEYSNNTNITKAIRFIELEKHLDMYEYVLFTDIDMLFVNDGDIIKRHIEQVQKDKTEVYENWLTVHDGTRRLSGVHFITKKWWEKTKAARESIAQELKCNTVLGWDGDEKVLLSIVEKSSLPVSPNEKRIWRHHAIHLGDIVYSILNGTPYSFSQFHVEQLAIYFNDPHFYGILSYIADQKESFKKVAHFLKENQKNVSSPVNVQFTPIVPIPKKFKMVDHTGELCIYTKCDENYQWYVPLFLKSLESFSKNHQLIPYVDIVGKPDDAMLKLCGENAKYIHRPNVSEKYPSGGYAVAASRFIDVPNTVKDYQYTLITDIDILMYPESMSILNQHMMHMEKDKTQVYENWISQWRDSTPRLPGVHFVTREWWIVVANAMREEYNKICDLGSITDYWYDEVMLGRIVQKANLPLPPAEAKLWRHHGVHLGDWRLNIDRKQLPRPNVFELMHIDWMLKNPEMSNLLDVCGEKITLIKEVKKMWPMLFR